MSNLQLVQLTPWLPPTPDYKDSGSRPWANHPLYYLTLQGLQAGQGGGNGVVLTEVIGNKFMHYDTFAKHSPVSSKNKQKKT